MIKLMEDRLFADGYNDIISISEHKVQLKYKTHDIVIEGEKLKIASFSKHEMIVFGQMLSLVFLYHDI